MYYNDKFSNFIMFFLVEFKSKQKEVYFVIILKSLQKSEKFEFLSLCCA
jgi:hypothetical protein